jgi:hypothetical protein
MRPGRSLARFVLVPKIQKAANAVRKRFKSWRRGYPKSLGCSQFFLAALGNLLIWVLVVFEDSFMTALAANSKIKRKSVFIGAVEKKFVN